MKNFTYPNMSVTNMLGSTNNGPPRSLDSVARGKRVYTKDEEQFQKRLGQRIKALRTEAGFVQDDFADRSSLDRSSVSPMEQGRYDVRLSTLLRVADTLNMRVDELLRQVVDAENSD